VRRFFKGLLATTAGSLAGGFLGLLVAFIALSPPPGEGGGAWGPLARVDLLSFWTVVGLCLGAALTLALWWYASRAGGPPRGK
jgi:hypothetical protein